ncbi:MAG: 2-oxoacid:acceptor oxidoreductase family protein [Syntrophaceae bacterium]|nr:2-oxoacid:acceptor oxidoreductase family protein [Syntrophaceae bacterium]
MRREIIFTGFGGQGIILMGVIIARMMEHFPELEVTQAQSYGPASRGGACRTDVVISDERINYPKSSRPDVMIFMSEEARKRLLGEADQERTLVVYDNTLVKAIPDNYKKTFAVPATGVAEKDFQNRMVANIYMLGATIELINPGSLDVLKKIVSESVPKKFEELNIKALEAGHAYYEANKP